MLEMENSIQIKLQCSASDPNALYSLLELMLDKMKFLHGLYGNLQQVELKLFDDASILDVNSQSDKIAFYRMSNDTQNIIEYSRSKRWDDALLNTIEKIQDRFAQLNPLEKTA
jgi:hypothetical protein